MSNGAVEFLVEIEIGIPAEMDSVRRLELTEAERVRGRELLNEGRLVSIWRIPGRSANAGIWSAEDGTQLHEAISSLPLFPWFDVRVTALATHPLQLPHEASPQ